MYIPASNAEPRLEVLHEFIRACPLAIMVSGTSEGLLATHLPLLLDASRGAFGTLEGHIARANAHHRLATTTESLIVFQGPDAYITPSWYASKAEHGKVVPTWNYIAVHAYGTIRFRDDEPFLYRHLTNLTARQETGREYPWAITDAPPTYVQSQLRAIVGLEIELTRLEGKWKMSQNRSDADIDGVVEGLGASSRPMDREVAEIVDAARPHRPAIPE